MANVVVVGSQWGDEGKGKIVDWLSERADVVVRFHGGHNAGHTLVIDRVSYKLALLPSGLVQGKLSVIGNGVVVDPWALIEEIDRIRAALGDRALQVEHIGSTSVPELIAKPCIDICLVVADAGDDDAYVPDLQRAGYVLRHREIFHGEPHRVFKASDMNINLHVHSQESAEAAREIAFRDWLRTHPEDRDRYAAAKRRIASQRWQYMQDYADAKDGIVAEIGARIREATSDAG